MVLPSRAQHVVLRLPDGSASHALVDAADAEVLTLVMTSRSPLAPQGGLAVVEYTTPRGVHRLSGAMAPGGAPDVVRVRREGRDDVVQRRDFLRVDAAVPVVLTVTEPVRGAAHTTSLNISAGGLLFSDPLGLAPGTVVDVEIEIAPGSATVKARGRIVREVGAAAKGVAIDAIAHDDRERLVRFVTERERLALRIARGG